MAETREVIDGKLRISETAETVIKTMTVEEIKGKIAEVQTEIDHLKIDLIAKEAEKQKWHDDLSILLPVR